MNRPSNRGRMVDTPLLTTGGLPGWNQKLMSTSQVPLKAVRRACSGSGPGATTTPVDGIGGSAVAVVTTALAMTSIPVTKETILFIVSLEGLRVRRWAA